MQFLFLQRRGRRQDTGYSTASSDSRRSRALQVIKFLPLCKTLCMLTVLNPNRIGANTNFTEVIIATVCTLNWSNVKRYILLYMCFLIIFNHLLDSFLIRVWFVNEKGITSLVRVYSSIDIKRGCNTFWSFILQYFAFRLSVPFSAFTFHYVSALYNIFKDRPHSILKINQ